MGACVTHAHTHIHLHTQKQAVRQPALCWSRNIFAILVLWHLPSIRTIIHYSQPQQCVPVYVCLCVSECVRAHVSVYHRACVVTICSHRIFGEPRSQHSSLRICFSSLFLGTWACFLWMSEERNTMLHSCAPFSRFTLKLFKLRSFTGRSCGLFSLY